jgi:hypothetical protein
LKKIAHKWAERSFYFGTGNATDHRADIDKLSPYIHYLETYHRKIYEKVSPAWDRFHGGTMETEINESLYHYHPEWGKDYWINQLFEIADKLRET